MTAAVEVLDKAKARELTDQIKAAVARIAHLPELVAAAYEGRAWEALGFASWDAYCTTELDTDHVKIPRGDRGEIVTQLRGRGLSVRAIAAATGASVGTVAADLAGVQNRTPEHPQDDGATPGKAPVNVVGIDGKQYAATPPRPPARPAAPPRRGPLADSYIAAALELDRVVRRIEKLHQDDRFGRHRRDLGEHFGGRLALAIDTLTELRAQLEVIDTTAVEK